MQAVFFLGNRELEINEVPDPTPGPGEAIIEIKASGMCGSDLKMYRVPGGAAALGLGGDGTPVIAGHEPCGVVVETGAGVTLRDAQVGARVMNHHYEGCGACHHCRGGWTQMCDDGAIVYGATGNGAHARYMKVPAHTLVPLHDNVIADGQAQSGRTFARSGSGRQFLEFAEHLFLVLGADAGAFVVHFHPCGTVELAGADHDFAAFGGDYRLFHICVYFF